MITVTQTITTLEAVKVRTFSVTSVTEARKMIEARMKSASRQGYAVAHTSKVDADGYEIFSNTLVEWTARHDGKKSLVVMPGEREIRFAAELNGLLA